MIPAALVTRLFKRANAARWGITEERFSAALTTSASRAFADARPSPRELENYLSSLHLEDLALACACADANDAAWDHFVLVHRPVLYRSADALAPGGAAREVADSLYAELFGLKERDGQRQSLFRYFHGRSSLATWLRAVLSQRFVDRVRTERRIDPLPDNDVAEIPSAASAIDPDRGRYLSLLTAALTAAIGGLPNRDRLRLSLYYAQQLTLAEAGRILKESEATVSRQLARTRRALRAGVERSLRTASRLSDEEVTRCFESVAADAGPLDLQALLGSADPCKTGERDRSI